MEKHDLQKYMSYEEGKVKYCTSESSISKDQDAEDDPSMSTTITGQAEPIYVDALDLGA